MCTMYKNKIVNQNVIANVDCTNRDQLIDNVKSLQHIPALVFVKDLNSEYAGMSDAFAKFVGWKDYKQSLGKTDYQFPCQASEYADRFRADDYKVINANIPILNLEIYEFAAGFQSLITQKIPFKNNNGKTIATFCQSFDVSNINIFRCFRHLNHNDKKVIDSFTKSTTYILNSERCPLPLPARQQECLFWLVRGKTMKEIAYLLGLSERTVEDYIYCIKYKLRCYTKGQLIDKAIDSGFLYYIPERFLKYV